MCGDRMDETQKRWKGTMKRKVGPKRENGFS